MSDSTADDRARQSDTDPGARVQAVKAEIERTQTRLAASVDELRDRLAPSRIAEDAKRAIGLKAREAVGRASVRAARLARDGRTVATAAVDEARDFARRQPVAASLISATIVTGLAWLTRPRAPGRARRRR